MQKIQERRCCLTKILRARIIFVSMLTLTETSSTLNTSYVSHRKSSTTASIDESYISPMVPINNYTLQTSAPRVSDNSSRRRSTASQQESSKKSLDQPHPSLNNSSTNPISLKKSSGCLRKLHADDNGKHSPSEMASSSPLHDNNDIPSSVSQHIPSKRLFDDSQKVVLCVSERVSSPEDSTESDLKKMIDSSLPITDNFNSVTPKVSVKDIYNTPENSDGDTSANVSDWDNNTSVQLKPFDNQVGGHTSFFRFSQKAVCKPSVPREQYFYELLEKSHPELLPFIPKYLGTVNVINRAHDGDVKSMPEVVFEQNKHLLPKWMLNRVNSFDSHYYDDNNQLFDKENNKISSVSSAPNLCSPKVNQDLKNEVLQEVFSPSVVRARVRQIQALQKEPIRRRHSITNVATLRRKSECKTPEMSENMDSPCEKRQKLPITGSPDLLSSKSGNDHGDTTLTCLTDCRQIRRSSNDHFSSMTLVKKEKPNSYPNLTESTSHTGYSHEQATSDMHSAFNMGEYSSSSKPTLRLQYPTEENSDEELVTPPHSPTLINNPWSLHCYSLQKSDEALNNLQQFIILQDLTGGLKYPCVLDLKMGTRQYGIDAKPKKRENQMKKCAKTTSKTLGDKYYGRSLNNETFFSSLVDFINNGKHVLVHHIPVILRKLRRLAKIIRKLSNYRFYGSSLLLIYDGDENNPRDIDVKIIDFAHCTTGKDYLPEEFLNPPHEGCDKGYLLGLKNLCQSFERIYKETYGIKPEDVGEEEEGVFSEIGEEHDDNSSG
ncbi:19133_t:CDS:2 [Cetraspora pellucida]|uniref:Kinase n=1 Tax=Cetraspora pellucida TaxID=1433469 RepID=A0A9N8VSH4_9GLOM|nr:19133_t:CDS:2 [Cetraspora pellucida]